MQTTRVYYPTVDKALTCKIPNNEFHLRLEPMAGTKKRAYEFTLSETQARQLLAELQTAYCGKTLVQLHQEGKL